MNIGTIDTARELVFTMGRDDRFYILQSPELKEDYIEFITRYPKHDVKRTTEFYIDDTEGQWFACFNMDCFDPPFAVVRARSWESAYEVFCDEFERWLAVDESSTADYPEEDRNYNGNGTHIDTDNVQIHQLSLIQVTTQEGK
jgi:hypothetical protein